jgi:hypothetical protein
MGSTVSRERRTGRRSSNPGRVENSGELKKISGPPTGGSFVQEKRGDRKHGLGGGASKGDAVERGQPCPREQGTTPE